MNTRNLPPRRRRPLRTVTALSFAAGLGLALAGGCDDVDPEGVADDGPIHLSQGPPHADVGSEGSDDPAGAAIHVEHERPLEVMPDAEAKFYEVLELIDREYVDGPLGRDELYTAALEGVMDRLIQHPHAEINALLSPRELEELHAGTAGSIVGIGVAIELVADVVVIREVIAGGPAEAGKLRPGDRILGVNGKRINETPLIEVVGEIRGEAGTTVDIFVQRDTEEWTETLTRGEVEIEAVNGRMLDERVGLLRIDAFNERTVEQVDATIQSLLDEGAQALVLDLRHCPGGLLDPALAVSSRFLAPGQRIVSMRGKGGQERHVEAEGEHPWSDKPMTVIVGEYTASGAEILAAALAHHGRAHLVGERTKGKGTVESVHKLDNGWAVKLSIHRFFSPDGQARHGRGVEPDFFVPGSKAAMKVPFEEATVEGDPQLRAAVELVSP